MRTGRFPKGKRPVFVYRKESWEILIKMDEYGVPPMKKILQKFYITVSCIFMLAGLCLTATVCSAAPEEDTVSCIADGNGAESLPVMFTEGEMALLCRFISEECRDQPYICRVAAAAVVLNRMEAAGFPDTVEKVIFSADAFSSVKNYTIGVHISKEDLDLSMQAVRQALGGEDPTGGALRFVRGGEPEISGSFRAGDMVFGW